MDYTPEYVALIAAQAAYHSSLNVAPAPAPPKPALPNCPQCKGTGKIRTGDNQNWTTCPCTERAHCPDGQCPPKRS